MAAPFTVLEMARLGFRDWPVKAVPADELVAVDLDTRGEVDAGEYELK